MITHVKFVSVPTRDQDRALKFWTERVGFQVATDQPFNDKQRWIELRIGSSETRVVLFVFDEQGLKPGMPFNGALACDNVERTYDELLARGVEFVSAPQKQPWGPLRCSKIWTEISSCSRAGKSVLVGQTIAFCRLSFSQRQTLKDDDPPTPPGGRFAAVPHQNLPPPSPRFQNWESNPT
jgi:catechol 2,3-dioxygenase-like lactoylglutathione lyase family enzyme